MTLQKVRVHLSERTAKVPGIGFVAVTRVKHPWDLVFEEDLPDYREFMSARRKPAYRARRRFELRQEAAASRTLRKYGFCEADVWLPIERKAALDLLEALGHVRNEQRERLRDRCVHGGVGRNEQDEKRQGQDAYAYLWPDGEPDFESLLAGAVAELAARKEERRPVLQSVAERLLDQSRVRRATAEEVVIGERLLCSLSQGCDAPVVDPPVSQSSVATVSVGPSSTGSVLCLQCQNPMTFDQWSACLLYTSPSPRDATLSRMPSSA